jgi:hypothetical protein
MGKALHVPTFIAVCVYMMTMGRCVECRMRRLHVWPLLAARLDLGPNPLENRTMLEYR